MPAPEIGALSAGENHVGSVGGHIVRAMASFVRPADTNAYAIGDLVANDVVAGNVAPLVFNIGRGAGLGGMIRRARLRKSGLSIASASFRLRLYSGLPVPQNGDNGVWLTSGVANYVGAIDIVCDALFTDGAAGNGVPNVGSEIGFTAEQYWGLLEARGAYVPASGESFEALLETYPN